MAVTNKGSGMKPTMLAALLAERYRLEEDPSWLRERIKFFASSGRTSDVALYLKIEDLTLDLYWSTVPVIFEGEPTHMIVSAGYSLANIKDEEDMIGVYVAAYMDDLGKYIHLANDFSLGKEINLSRRRYFSSRLAVIVPALPYELPVIKEIDELKSLFRITNLNIKVIVDYILWFWKNRFITAFNSGEIKSIEIGLSLIDVAVAGVTYAASIRYRRNATTAQLYELMSFYGDPHDKWDLISGRMLYRGHGQEYVLEQAVREVANSDNANPLSIAMIHLILKLIQDGKISRTSLSGQIWMASLGRRINVTNTWRDYIMKFKRVLKMDRSKNYMRNVKMFGDDELKRLAEQCPELIKVAGDIWCGV